MNKVQISGFEKLTLLNYPGQVACMAFTKGCNFKCPFCHNSELIDINGDYETIDEDNIFAYLRKRKGVLDGICISGGEPLIQKDIESLIKRIKEMGYLVKLDTNGSNPTLLKKLIDEKLIDYVAMDIKNTWNKYEQIIGCKINISNLQESVKILENSDIDYEFRTTLVKEYHTVNDVLEICHMLNGKSKYYLQNFRNSEGVLDKSLTAFTLDELEEIKKKIEREYQNVMFRDI